ncbi:MAG: hypothetical protein WBM14_14620, partial [Terracidiphilus sp.]
MTAAREQGTLTVWEELERVLEQVQQHAQPDAARDSASAAKRDGCKRSGAPSTRGHEEVAESERWSPVVRLRELFGLSRFEMDTLLLCAGVALDKRFAEACAAAPPAEPAANALW